MLQSEYSNSLRKVFFLPARIILAPALFSFCFSVYADSEWIGQGITNNWTNVFNWIGGVPDKSASEQVRFSNRGPSVLNENWVLGSLSLEASGSLGGENEWRVSNSSVLTIHEGISYGFPGCGAGTFDQSNCRGMVYFPITLGDNAGIETIPNSTRFDPNNTITFNGSINTNGKILGLRPFGAEIIINAVITGSGGLQKDGGGDARLTKSNTYTGSTSILDGDLITSGSGRLPDSSDLRVFGNGRFLMASNTADAINGLYGDGRVGINSGNTLVIGNYDGFNSEGNGNFTGELFGTGGNLFKRGIDGTQTLNGQINLGGEIFVEEGTLNIGSSATVLNTPRLEVAEQAILNMDNNGDYGRLIVEGTANLSGNTTFTSMRIANGGGVTNARLTQNGGSIESAQAIFGFNGQGEFVQQSGTNNFTSLQLGLESGSQGYYQLNSGTVQTGNGIIGYFGEGVFDHFGGDHNVAGTLSLAEAAGSTGQYSLESGTLTTEVTEVAALPDDPDAQRGNATFVNDGGTHTSDRLVIGNGGVTGLDDSGEGYYEITSGVTNADRINIWSTGILFINGGTVNARVIDNRFTGLLDFSAGTLSSEIVFGSLVNRGGMLSPGNSPGLLSISNDYTQESNASLLIELGGITPETEYDVVEVGGIATLDGILDVVLFGNYSPSGGETFDILSAASIVGMFSTVNLPSIQGILWEIQTLVDEIGSTDVLRLTALAQPVPLPSSVWFFLSSLGLIVLIKRRKP